MWAALSTRCGLFSLGLAIGSAHDFIEQAFTLLLGSLLGLLLADLAAGLAGLARSDDILLVSGFRLVIGGMHLTPGALLTVAETGVVEVGEIEAAAQPIGR